MARRKKEAKVVQHGVGYNEPNQNKVGVALDVQHVVNWAVGVDPAHLLGLRELCDAKGASLGVEPGAVVKATDKVGTLNSRGVLVWVDHLTTDCDAVEVEAFKSLWGTLQALTAKARRREQRLEVRKTAEVVSKNMLDDEAEKLHNHENKKKAAAAVQHAASQVHKPQVTRSQKV